MIHHTPTASLADAPQGRLAAYAGTFDPLTSGHENIVRRAAGLFDRVVVAVAAAHHKKTLFTLDERVKMAEHVFADLHNVSVCSYAGLMRDFVLEHGVQLMVRGLRSATDFDYEMQLAGLNKALMPQVETVFFPTDVNFQFVSSTYVREIAALGGSVQSFVPPHVLGCLTAKLKPVNAQSN